MMRQKTRRQYQIRCSREKKPLETQGGTTEKNRCTKPVEKGRAAKMRKPREGPTKARRVETTTRQRTRYPGSRESRLKSEKDLRLVTPEESEKDLRLASFRPWSEVLTDVYLGQRFWPWLRLAWNH